MTNFEKIKKMCEKKDTAGIVLFINAITSNPMFFTDAFCSACMKEHGGKCKDEDGTCGTEDGAEIKGIMWWLEQEAKKDEWK